MNDPLIKCIAFDCFGTVFDMSSVPREEIAAYVAHVKKADFTPYSFPASWWKLKAHPDAADGIWKLRNSGYHCVTLSNGGVGLLQDLATQNRICFDHYVNLIKHRAYKPHNLDAYRAVEKDTGFKPSETLMVTANKTFGDVESSQAIGMRCQIIRHGYPNTIIELAEKLAKQWA